MLWSSAYSSLLRLLHLSHVLLVLTVSLLIEVPIGGYRHSDEQDGEYDESESELRYH